MTPQLLFSVANTIVIPFWILLTIAPSGPLTRRLVQSGFTSALLSILYLVALAVSTSGDGNGGFGSLESVRTLFANDWALLAGWVHYLAFDLYIGSMIASEHVAANANRFFLVLKLAATFMLGPVGFLMHKASQKIVKKS